MPSLPTRWSGLVSTRRLIDLVTTILALGALSAFVQGRTPVTVLGLRWRTPSLGVSVILLVVWVGGRFVLRHRQAFAPRSTAAVLRRFLPEILVGVLFAVGLAMRLTGIDFGAPLDLHPDESVVVGAAAWMLQSGWIKPPVPYHYPTVFPYLLLPAFALYYVKGQAAGLWTSLADMNRDAFGFYELARAHSAVLGALTIPVMYRLARKMWDGDRGRWAGVMAAAFVTFSFNHIKQSHYGVTDAALTFFVALAFLAILAAYRRGSASAYALAGFACGIACATKYSGLPVVAGLLVAHLADGRRAWTRWPRLVAGLAAVPLGFFAGFPYSVLNWPPFLEHLGWLSGISDAPADAAARFNYLVVYSSKSGFGWLFTLALGIAIVVALYRRRAAELSAIGVMAVAVALMSHSSHRFFPRYLLPVLPFAALLVAGALTDGAAWASRRMPRHPALVPAGAALATLVLVWPQAHQAVEFVGAIRLPDTRVQAYHYILEQFPPGSVIASEVPYLELPAGYHLLRWGPLESHDPADFVQAGVDALVFTSDNDSGPAHDARASLERHFPFGIAFPSGPRTAPGPTITIYLGHVR
jgi:Dolichyl-phosphate-mannose-protein mannosyltransferase